MLLLLLWIRHILMFYILLLLPRFKHTPLLICFISSINKNFILISKIIFKILLNNYLKYEITFVRSKVFLFKSVIIIITAAKVFQLFISDIRILVFFYKNIIKKIVFFFQIKKKIKWYLPKFKMSFFWAWRILGGVVMIRLWRF